MRLLYGFARFPPLYKGPFILTGGILASIDFSVLAKLVRDTTASLLQCDSVALYLVDESAGEVGEMWDEAALGFTGEPQNQRLPANVGFAGSTVESKLPANSMRATLDRRYDRRVDEHGAGRTTRILCAPLKNPLGKVVGVISACDVDKGLKNMETKSFGPEENLFLQALASQLAMAVDANIHRQSIVLEAQAGRLQGAIGGAMATCNSVRQLCHEVAEIIRRAFDAEACVILLLEGRGQDRHAVREGVALPFEQNEPGGPPGCARELGLGEGQIVPLQDGLLVRLLEPQGRRPISIDDVASSERDLFHPNLDQKYEPPVRNLLAIHLEEPTINANETSVDDEEGQIDVFEGMMGAIKIINKIDPNRSKDKEQHKLFTEADKKVLGSLPVLLAQQVVHMRREQRQDERLLEEHEMLISTGKLMKQESLEGLSRALFDNICAKTNCSTLCLYARCHRLVRGEEAYQRVTCHSDAAEVLSDNIPVRPSLIESVFESGRILNITNCQGQHQYNPKVDRPLGVSQVEGALLAVPILEDSGKVSGVIVQYDKLEGAASSQFSISDEEYTTSVATMVDVVVKNVHMANAASALNEQIKEKMELLQDKLDHEYRIKEMREEMQRIKDAEEAERQRLEDEQAAIDERRAIEDRLAQQDMEIAKERADEAAAEAAGMPVELHARLSDPKYVESLRALAEFCGLGKTDSSHPDPEQLVRHMKRVIQEGREALGY